MKKIIGVSKLDCYPILFVESHATQEDLIVKFQQRFAGKYVVVKLIASHMTNATHGNIDMYGMTLNGHTMKLPTIETE